MGKKEGESSEMGVWAGRKKLRDEMEEYMREGWKEDGNQERED